MPPGASWPARCSTRKDRIVARVLSRERMRLDRGWIKKRLERAIALQERTCRSLRTPTPTGW